LKRIEKFKVIIKNEIEKVLVKTDIKVKPDGKVYEIVSYVRPPN
jgi:hypothetical protein